MNTQEALKIVGGLSKPSKMPGWAYGLPAQECKTGSKLRQIKNSTCSGCYALKGCYVFPVVKAAQYRRLEATKDSRWVDAMVHLLNSKKSKELLLVSKELLDWLSLFQLFQKYKYQCNMRGPS